VPEQTQLGNVQSVRFAVLRHTDKRGDHFDLLIDSGPLLATWKCPRPPEQAVDSTLSFARLKDHRRLYLDYEGPLTDDRGTVQRYDEGECLIHERTASRWELTFRGQRLAGRFALEALSGEGDEWCLRFTPPA
jgi:hypothetical protein